MVKKARKKQRKIMEHTNKPQVLNEESIKVHDYADDKNIAPFKILQRNDEFSIILGNNIVSEKTFTLLKFAEDYIKSKPYELIIALIGLTIEMQEQYKKEQEQLKKFKDENKC